MRDVEARQRQRKGNWSVVHNVGQLRLLRGNDGKEVNGCRERSICAYLILGNEVFEVL